MLPIVRTETQRERCTTAPCVLFNEFTASTLLDMDWSGASLVHLMGASRDYVDQSMWESTVGTTDVVTEVARRAGVSRIVYLSWYGVCAGSSGTIL